MRNAISQRVLLAVLMCLVLAKCGGTYTPTPAPPVTPPPVVTPPTPAITMDISPDTASVIITQSQQFTATVANTSNKAVHWSVNGTPGGDSTVGTISATGLYTAPAKLPQNATITVAAASAADTTKSASGTVTVSPYAGVFTFHNDNRRSGQNQNETILTPANVNATKFGKIFGAPVDGFVSAQPLYLSHVAIPGQGFHNVAYVATEHDSVYAFDADGLSPTALWTKSFIDVANGIITIPPDVGVTGTPVIDNTTGTIYILAATQENGTAVHRLHALDVTNGAEKFGGPVTVQATVSGTGSGASNGQIVFDATVHRQRASLLLLNGTVYVAWASYGDKGLYHGWIIAYDAATLQQTAVWNTTPNGIKGGIWLANCGLSADSDGNIYALTGNGTFNADTGGTEYSDSFIKLNLTGGGLVVTDFFTPFNQAALDLADMDLGSSGLVLLPDMNGPVTHLGITAGKEGKIYVVNLDNLGKYQSGSDSQIVQSLPNALGTTANGRNLSTAVYWQGNVYFAGNTDFLKQYKITNGQLTPTPAAQTAHTFGFTASSSLSSNGATDGILWTTELNSAVLYAFDANNVATELYDSAQAANGRDASGLAVRFNPPTVVNGKVYVAGQTEFAIFGLLP